MSLLQSYRGARSQEITDAINSGASVVYHNGTVTINIDNYDWDNDVDVDEFNSSELSDSD